jgi:hypothetical protein
VDRRSEAIMDMSQWQHQNPSKPPPAFSRLDKTNSILPPTDRRSEAIIDISQWQQGPSSKLPPAQNRALSRSPAQSGITATTVFEDDRPPVPRVPDRKPLPNPPVPGLAIHYPPPPPPPPKPRQPAYNKQQAQSPQHARQPSLALDIPRQATRNPDIPTIDAFPLPPAPKRTAQPPPPVPHQEARDSTGSVLEYYASPQAGYHISPNIDLPTPVRNDANRCRAKPNGTPMGRPVNQPRHERVTSAGSDTSFESLGIDEPTPPEEVERQLTPVPETPIAGIRYPKVPRPSNQAVARSPRSPMTKVSPELKVSPSQPSRPKTSPRHDRSNLPLHTGQVQNQNSFSPVTPERKGTNSSSLSGSTLAAKRLGDSAAQDLERRLYVADSAYTRVGSQPNSRSSPPKKVDDVRPMQDRAHPAERHDSPLKGYGRVTSGGRVRPSVNSTVNSNVGLWLNMVNGMPPKPPRGSEREPSQSKSKLTPERRGDDLYLSVGMATPGTEGSFRRR